MKRIFLLVALFAVIPSLFANEVIKAPTSIVRPSPILPSSNLENPVQPNGPLADPAFFANIPISKTGESSETGIAVNPLNPNQLVCSANDFSCGATMKYWYSSDAGLTWTAHCLQIPGGSSWDDPFDPTVTYDSRGNAYLCFGNSFGSPGRQNGIFVAKSTDGGNSFQAPVTVVANLLNQVSGSGGTQPFEDKFYIACDANPASPHRDNLYITWSHDPPGQGFTIQCVTSTNGGKTWSSPTDVSTNGNPQGSMPITGPDGALYVAWGNNGSSTTSGIIACRSDDGGASFNQQKSIATVLSIGEPDTNGRLALASKQGMRVSTFPSIAADNSSGPHKGTVFIVWAGLQNGDPHVFLSMSTTRGSTWTAGRVIDQGNSGLDVFMPSIAVDPVTGDVVIDYFDSRNSADNTGFDIYASVSHDGGQTFSEYRITDKTTKVYGEGQADHGGIYFGDYQGICAYGGTAWPCWWDCRTGAGFNNVHIYTAQIRNSANPVTAVTAKSSCDNPTSIELTWKDPTTTTLGNPIGTFSVQIFRDGTSVGTVESGVQTFTDNGLTPGDSYTYSIVASGTAAASTPATLTAFAGGGGQPAVPTNLHLRPISKGIEATWVNPSTHVDGTAACDFHAIYFYNDTSTVPIDSLVQSSTAVGASMVRNMVLDSTKIWKIYLRAVTADNGKIILSDTTPHFASFAGAPRSNPNYTFDGAAPVLYTTQSWGVNSNYGSPTAPCLSDNQTLSSLRNKTSFCQLAPFVLKSPDTTLTFNHIFLSASTGKGTVQISRDNGVTWRDISSYTTASDPTDWHDSVRASKWVLDRRSLVSHAGSITAKLGDTVSIRFLLASAFAVGQGWYIDDIKIFDTVSAVRESNVVPASLTLEQNYPNPFNPSTIIRFAIPSAGNVELDVVDALGKTVATLVREHLDAGSYSSEFHADELPSGSYFSILRAEGMVKTSQMVLIK